MDQPQPGQPTLPSPAITVSGVTFTAEQVKSAVVTIDGRDIFIGEKTDNTPKVGFPLGGK